MNGQYRVGDTVMKNWVIQKKLGEGSFGKVYEIQRRDFGETYRAALKIITVPQSSSEIQAALEEGMNPQEAEQYFYSMVEDIVREFALMARVKGTAYVVSYEDHEVVRHDQGLGWDILIRMEELTPLLSYAYAHPFTRRDVIRLGIHMCKSLELCQKYNIIHRDIKPENIFVSENGDFKLGDFGIARTVEKTMSGLSKKGTYNYMAPEVYKGLEYGFSVDIYSLGIVLYRLLNKNRVPFLPPAPEKLTYTNREKALARRMSGEELPRPVYGQGRLGEIVLKAAAYHPKDRYSSPGQMREELEAILYSEEDASVIYPEGDEISLKENIYATMNRGGGKVQGSVQEDEASVSDEWENGEEETISAFGGRTGGTGQRDPLEKESSGATEKESEAADETVSVFGTKRTKSASNKTQKSDKTSGGQNGRPSGEASGKVSGGKKGIVAAVAAVAVIVIAGAVMTLGKKSTSSASNPSGQGGSAGMMEQDSQTKAETYTQLVNQAATLYDSDPSGAMELMDQALALYPDENGAQTDYAYALYRTGDYDGCVSYVEQDLGLGESFQDAELKKELIEILAVSYYEKGDYAGAASYFRLSAAGSEMSESSMRDYAVCLARLGSLSEARDALAQLRASGANSDVTRYVEGELACAEGEYLEADNIFSELLEDGEDEEILQRTVRSAIRMIRDQALGERDGIFLDEILFEEDVAECAFIKILMWESQIDSHGLSYDSSVYEMVGEIYSIGADETYWEMVEACFSYGTVEAYWEMIRSYAGLDEYEDILIFMADHACKAFEKVISLGIQKEYLYTNQYVLYYGSSQWEKADDILGQMETAFPRSYLPHALKGILYITLENQKAEADRDYGQAAAEWEKATELLTDSDDKTYYQQLQSLIEQLKQQGWM